LGDESLAVVYNGVDVDQVPFRQHPEDFFIVVGRMTPGKGIAEAIRIARKAKIRLVIVGHVTSHLPWSEEYFKKEVQPYLDGDNIRHIDRLPNLQLLRLMGRARGLLFPLQWDEPFGMVVVEAMATGTPVLAYRRGAMPELIRHEDTGFLLETETEMVAALGSIGMIQRGRCREWVRSEFSVERMVDGYEELYEEVVRRYQR
jgi:glycosyltransferase involved in cell wall biosynthesis